jgi:hypothetical protein
VAWAILGVELVALLLYGNLVVLLHELGHAALARWSGLRTTSFGLGAGRPIATFVVRGVVVHVDTWPVGGSCVAVPTGPNASRRWLFHTGGLLAQGALGLALLTLPPHWLVERITSFNLLVAVTNLLPWRVGDVASDGWYLLDAARGQRKTGELVAQHRRLTALALREREVRSPVGSTYADIVVAWADLQRGRPELARDLIERDPPHTALEPWFDILYTVVRAEWFRAHDRPLDALRAIRDARAAREPDASTAEGDVLTLAECRVLLDLGSPEPALRGLSTVLGAPGPPGRQAAALLPRALLDAAPGDLEAATLRAVRASTGALLDPVDAAATLDLAADALEATQHFATARRARAASAALIERVIDALDPSDERHVLSRLVAARRAPRAGAGRGARRP